jgi:hypothetical protein
VSIDTLIVCSCDRTYFPLLKGLILSIVESSGALPSGIGLGFIDLGCEVSDVGWLLERGVRVCAPDPAVLGRLAEPALGYRRAQTCRPLLPSIFPDVERFVWIDSDAWVQDVSIFAFLREALGARPEQLFISPECHYSYTGVHADSQTRRDAMFGYYEPLFGAEVAGSMSRRVMLNSGFFAMCADNHIWKEWGAHVRRIFLEEHPRLTPLAHHLAEQTALNVVATRRERVTLLDPLYNYICLWNPPLRDADGIVKVALPPHLPIGIVHLAGGWRHRQAYFDRDLLYRRGEYLTTRERALLQQASGSNYR